ncbi:uncharacterized protein BCR38DRAFT_453037 [Pseudomassariella vexata]|uniref:Uncharacterized protein n=1 Tax=Pseudomassariella vexata TaxID=1141098 RepID=A0A1Y2D6R3_9PEZI|nr:uncharacterized protein BCR38DRAFT_453037 [Pseudomassariella vexata]ORY54972.1 hypothetical protein BCR38DRAFT_453037 [Pseudomassariella vexata]
MQDAALLGYNVAMLTSTSAGQSTFDKLGFREIGTVRMFVWHPLPPSTQGRQSSLAGSGVLRFSKSASMQQGLTTKARLGDGAEKREAYRMLGEQTGQLTRQYQATKATESDEQLTGKTQAEEEDRDEEWQLVEHE